MFPLAIQLSHAFRKLSLGHLAFMKDLHLVPVFASLTEKIQREFSLFMKKGKKKKQPSAFVLQ